METYRPLLKDADGEDVDEHLYRSMIGSLMYLTHQGLILCLNLDKKSTTGGCQFLGCRLISWQCKKQTMVANSTTEGEYVAALSCCGQIIHKGWLKWNVTAARDEIEVKTSNLRVNAVVHYLVLMGEKAKTRIETASKQSNGPPLSRVNTLRSGEDIPKLKELMDLCTKLSDRVLDLETTKTAQAKEIASLKKRVKKLERKRKSKTPGMNLFKIGSDFDEEFDANMDEAIEQVYDANKDTVEKEKFSTTGPITTASVNITAAEPTTPPTITTVFEDEDLTIAQTLVRMRSEKSKVRGVVIKEPSETATKLTLPPQQHDPKDKGKGKMVKQENPINKKDQIKFDEEIAQRLQAQMQAELEEEERLARERKEDANIWLNGMIFCLGELMDKRKKHFARLRAEEQRRKPLTKAQKRNQMCAYLKNIAGFTHNQLKNKSFNEVQKAFDKTMS
ncbi:hypothetical protein Tco_0796007 [Tanacetum coccineum]